MVALTSIVTMDKETWFHDVTPIDMNVFENNLKLQYQLDLTIKTGMLGTQDIIKRAGDVFVESGADYFVVDPVMVCKGEDEVLNPGNTEAMIQYLLLKLRLLPRIYSKQVNSLV